MKILVIFTGGTIGSVKSEGWIAPDDTTKYRLLESYKDADQKGIAFETASPYIILSENLSAKELTTLCGVIDDAVKGDYDGVIVAHGTDTLQYSASAAAFCVGADCTPVVFVSSGYPLESERSNGEANFEAAVEFIRAKAGRGVYISYANEQGGKVDIHTAARALRHPEMSDKVYSLGGTPYAECEGGVISCREDYIPSGVGEPLGKVNFCENAGLLTVTVNPTEQYRYDLEGVRAIILMPYHSGTLNTASEHFKAFCQIAKEKHIPIFLPDLPLGAHYASMKSYSDLGIIPLPPCSSVALTVKIWAGISLGLPLEDFVKMPIAQEF